VRVRICLASCYVSRRADYVCFFVLFRFVEKYLYIIVGPSLKPIPLRGTLLHSCPYATLERKSGTLERSSELADQMLASKHYSTTDHSYPRNEVIPQYPPRSMTDQSSMDSERSRSASRSSQSSRGSRGSKSSQVSDESMGAVEAVLQEIANLITAQIEGRMFSSSLRPLYKTQTTSAKQECMDALHELRKKVAFYMILYESADQDHCEPSTA
jgi:hypothetical protein